jgi:hypothetical protein
MQDGAYGFFGSTNVVYGPPDQNDWGDLICQFFFESLLEGASLGRAVLQARQTYLLHKHHLDGTDLKTLGQFYLLGDPSVTPVIGARAVPAAHMMRDDGGFVAATPKENADLARDSRRRSLTQNGAALGASVSTSKSRITRPRRSPGLRAALNSVAEGLQLQPDSIHIDTYKVENSKSLTFAKTLSFKGQGEPHDVLLGRHLPMRQLKAVHRIVGKVARPPLAEGGPPRFMFKGAEVKEYDNGLTIHPFVSK